MKQPKKYLKINKNLAKIAWILARFSFYCDLIVLQLYDEIAALASRIDTLDNEYRLV